MITSIIKQHIESKLEALNLDSTPTIEIPKKGDAHLAMPLFVYAKSLKLAPLQIFEHFKSLILPHEYIEDVAFLNGFLNIYLKKDIVGKAILDQVLREKNQYGQVKQATNEVVVIDYSSPNIAKSFSVGHLRSTVIGNALKNIYQKNGYETVGINYLGDWGTQFGKMIVAYQKWGDKQKIALNPIAELQSLYVRFHEESEKNSNLEDEARLAFLMLEQQNPTYISLWQYFKEESLKEFMHMYELLNVTFDSYDGESFFNDKMDNVIDELNQKNLLLVDAGATIVDLGVDLPPALIKKNDGATLYITRDLAALDYRKKTYHFTKALYVVGNEQRLHFQQLKKLSELLGHDWDIEHINFGLVLLNGEKMSTRRGNYKRLDDVLKQAIDDAYQAISQKNPTLENKDKVAKAVGVGAIIFNDLKNDRHLDIDFNLENMLKFEGQTGPYIQYSSVRIHSLLKGQTIFNKIDAKYFLENHYFDLLYVLDQFEDVIVRAKQNNAPSYIARYVLNLAQMFNSFYGRQKINVDDQTHFETNKAFIYAIQVVINECLRLLGIESLESM